MTEHAEGCWQGWCDGTARPNPGRLAIGGVLLAPDGQRYELSRATGVLGCNNEAEALALQGLLALAKTLGAQHLVAYSDSDVIVRLVADQSSSEAARLAPILCALRTQIAQFSSVTVRWIPQHRNSAADELARQALGLPPRPPAKPAKRRRR